VLQGIAEARRSAEKKMRLLDQNQMSNPANFSGTTDDFLIPDIAWFENIKSEGWRDDISRSFALFHKEPHRLHIAYCVGELLRQEMKTHQPVESPIDSKKTNQLQELLKNQNYVETIEENINLLRKDPIEPIVHLAGKRALIADSMLALHQRAGKSIMKQLRANRNELKSYTPSIAKLTDTSLATTLSDLGISDQQQKGLLCRQSAFYRYHFVYWAQVFQFSIGSPNLQTGDTRLLNDLVDSDYAVTASYCAHLETSDKKLQQLYEALMVAIKQ